VEGRKRGAVAKSIFEAVESGRAVIYVPGLVFAEILYLSEKRRIAASLSDVADYLAQYSGCREYPLSLAVIQAATQITDIPELHDRLIAGTARLLDLELMTNDPQIQTSVAVRTIW